MSIDFEKSFASHPRAECWSLKNICSGKWCSFCKNKTEKKLLEWLKINYNVKYQLRYDWCKNPNTNKYLPYDFEINNKIIIELDGRQHFEQVSNWRSPEDQLYIDKYKIKCALENNLSIIHIYQEDVWYNKNSWDINLEKNINDILLINKPILRLIGIDNNIYS